MQLDHEHRLKIETALANAVIAASRDANGIVHFRSTEILLAYVSGLVGHIVLAQWLTTEDEARAFANGVADLIVDSWQATKERVEHTAAPENVTILFNDPTAKKH